ncbi:MAG: RDD family protein [Sulfurimonadaceae bacterium]
MNNEVEHRLLRAGLELASVQKRAFAFFIDELLLAFLFLFIIYDQIASVSDPDAIVALINTFTFEYLLIKILYQTLFVYYYGATLGKILAKIQVVDAVTMQRPIFGSALNRGVFRIISEMIFYLGFIWAFYTENRQSWHDKTARTLVVNV